MSSYMHIVGDGRGCGCLTYGQQDSTAQVLQSLYLIIQGKALYEFGRVRDWYRVWTIQGIVLAKTAYLFDQSSFISWHDLECLLSTIRQSDDFKSYVDRMT